MYYGQMKRFISLQRRFSSYNRKNLTTYSLTWWIPYGEGHNFCLGKHLAELKMILMIKKLFALILRTLLWKEVIINSKAKVL